MTEVSRETPPAPDVARGVFSRALPQAEAFAAWLADQGTVRGLIGPREVPRLWERHLLNCAVIGEHIPGSVSVADVGSGAGLPGLVLAIARPDLQVTLIEPLLRRTNFLSEVIADLALSNVEVIRARADGVAERFDVVTSRAVAPLARLAQWCLPITRGGGLVLAMKGSSAAEEVQQTQAQIHRAGGGDVEILSAGAGIVDQPVTLVAFRRMRGA